MARPTLNALCRGGKEPAERADTPMSLLATSIATQVVLTFLTSVPGECHFHMHRARARARAPCVLLLELLLAFLPVHVTVCDLGFALFALAIACSFGDAAWGAVPAPPPVRHAVLMACAR